MFFFQTNDQHVYYYQEEITLHGKCMGIKIGGNDIGLVNTHFIQSMPTLIKEGRTEPYCNSMVIVKILVKIIITQQPRQDDHALYESYKA